ncbi:hypothetical protein N657DRAFT_669738 [Parathielavia appendiculata]|uniref:Uncharacterized protein n=1 Tax=Parathielavia appendiculata TaxID=2587402 RepID=A0AAN6U5E3_9PEZI|nr:hypothetical protein N657DRAFT_669738 [Parathielavia appendiculata]
MGTARWTKTYPLKTAGRPSGADSALRAGTGAVSKCRQRLLRAGLVTRVWTVQEFALARREQVWCCMRRSLSSPRLVHELMYLVRYISEEKESPDTGLPEIVSLPRFGAEGQFDTLLKTCSVVKELMTKKEALPLRLALYNLDYQESTDPRDYNYALRELLIPVEKPPSRQAIQSRLTSSLSRHQVPCSLFEDWNLHLYASYELLRSPGMPSWAFNFAKHSSSAAEEHHAALWNRSSPCPAGLAHFSGRPH